MTDSEFCIILFWIFDWRDQIRIWEMSILEILSILLKFIVPVWIQNDTGVNGNTEQMNALII